MFFVPIGNNGFTPVRWDVNYTGLPISDNAYNFTPTRLHDKSAKYIERIEELADILTQAIQAYNPKTNSSVPIPDISKKLIASDNLTESD